MVASRSFSFSEGIALDNRTKTKPAAWVFVFRTKRPPLTCVAPALWPGTLLAHLMPHAGHELGKRPQPSSAVCLEQVKGFYFLEFRQETCASFLLLFSGENFFLLLCFCRSCAASRSLHLGEGLRAKFASWREKKLPAPEFSPLMLLLSQDDKTGVFIRPYFCLY